LAETRVDLLHLLEDLRDAYPGALEETILTEVIANSLDSGATLIRISAGSAGASFTIVDNGSGMPRRDLRRYHDLATSNKARGRGIGFAGVGIKLALLACKEVVTESRRGKSHVASSWHLASHHRAPWRWIPPPGLVDRQGTAVALSLSDSLSPLADSGFVESAIRRHYQPLLDPGCEGILHPLYPQGIAFEVNGVILAKEACAASETAPLAIHVGRKRKPSAAGYLYREEVPVAEEARGLAISTYGKIIKCGWDWLGISPNAPDRIGGLIEVPMLSAALTLNKADFIRTGPRGAIYLAARKAVQEAVLRQLASWGDARDQPEPARPRAMRVLERDLERVLLDLSEGFPLLASLVEQRRGQKRLPLGPKTGFGDGPGPGAEPAPEAGAAEAGEGTEPGSSAPPEDHGEPPVPPREETPPGGGAALPSPHGEKRPLRLGLSVQFEDRPRDPEPGRLVESTVFVNRAHPAYRRAVASRSEGYHIALSVALALARLAVEPAGEHAFVTAFLSRWGDAVTGVPSRRGRAGIGRTAR
jgi:hypothetical protein